MPKATLQKSDDFGTCGLGSERENASLVACKDHRFQILAGVIDQQRLTWINL